MVSNTLLHHIVVMACSFFIAATPAKSMDYDIKSNSSANTLTNQKIIESNGLTLPASFTGDMPCADCQAVRYHLDLWQDQVFHLHREWVGKEFTRDEIGRWRINSNRKILILEGGAEAPIQFSVISKKKLKVLDVKGNPIDTKIPHELTAQQIFSPVDLKLYLTGEIVITENTAQLTECLTGQTYAIRKEHDYKKTEDIYRFNAASLKRPLYIMIEGEIIDLTGANGVVKEPSIIIKRLINAFPGKTCGRSRATAAVENTYWRIKSLKGSNIEIQEGRREPRIILQRREGKGRLSATIGCNALIGKYELNGPDITFYHYASTMMRCPPPLDVTENLLREVLSKTKRWRITGEILELYDTDGSAIAILEAVYL